MLTAFGVFVAALTPILKVIAIALSGAFCATQYAGILSQEGLKSLSRVIIYILVPCFLFTKLAGTLTIEKLGEWWLICAFVVLNNICGMLVGLLVGAWVGGRL